MQCTAHLDVGCLVVISMQRVATALLTTYSRTQFDWEARHGSISSVQHSDCDCSLTTVRIGNGMSHKITSYKMSRRTQLVSLARSANVAERAIYLPSVISIFFIRIPLYIEFPLENITTDHVSDREAYVLLHLRASICCAVSSSLLVVIGCMQQRNKEIVDSRLRPRCSIQFIVEQTCLQ